MDEGLNNSQFTASEDHQSDLSPESGQSPPEHSPEKFLTFDLSPFCYWPPDFGTVVVEMQLSLPALETVKSTSLAPIVHAKPQFFYEGIGYCSLSEAACASLLEEFVPNFEIEYGSTYQVPLGNGKSVDFAIGEVLIEYHPVRLRAERGRSGAFPTRNAYLQFQKELRRTRGNRSEAKRLFERTTSELKSHYQAKRERTIATSPGGGDRELVVATTFEEFYFSVLRRFAQGACPSLKKAQYLFHEAVRLIARERRKVRPKR